MRRGPPFAPLGRCSRGILPVWSPSTPIPPAKSIQLTLAFYHKPGANPADGAKWGGNTLGSDDPKAGLGLLEQPREERLHDGESHGQSGDGVYLGAEEADLLRDGHPDEAGNHD
jgi:hypothetical protein